MQAGRRKVEKLPLNARHPKVFCVMACINWDDRKEGKLPLQENILNPPPSQRHRISRRFNRREDFMGHHRVC